MVLLNSQPIVSGVTAPDFELPSVDGKRYRLQDFSDAKVLVVMFLCSHCPYVKAVEDRILALHREMAPKGVQFVAICSNDATDYPEDRPEALRKLWQEKQYGFPYLIDETQVVAKAFGAVCTPDIYVYNDLRNLAYHGRIDDDWQHPEKVTRQELKAAIEVLLAGGRPEGDPKPSMGCSIKWKK